MNRHSAKRAPSPLGPPLGPSPGLILAIQGGGGIFAELLSIELGEEIPLTTIHILAKGGPQEDRDGFLVNQTTKWMQFILRYLAQFYSSQKVVIVDDFCITGDSLASLRNGLKELGFASDNVKDGRRQYVLSKQLTPRILQTFAG